MYSCNSRAALPDHLRSGRALWSWNFSNRDEITGKATFEWLCYYLSRPYNKASEPLIGTSYIRLLVCSEALNFFSMRYYRKTPCNSKLIPGIKNEAISAHGIAKSCNCLKKKAFDSCGPRSGFDDVVEISGRVSKMPIVCRTALLPPPMYKCQTKKGQSNVLLISTHFSVAKTVNTFRKHLSSMWKKTPTEEVMYHGGTCK